MNPIQAILSAFRNCANFDGRACRSEYWWFYIFFVVWLIAIFVVSVAWFPSLFSLWVIYLIAMMLPLWSVTVRRLHDMDKSGRWAFLGFMPLAGGPRLTKLMALPGTVGPNRYGPDPLRPELGGGWTQRSARPVIPQPPDVGMAETTESAAGPRCSRCGWERWPDALFCADCGASF